MRGGTPMSEPEKLHEVLEALRLSIEQLSASKKTPEVDPRQHFYQTFNREADEYDKDFDHKYHDDLNTTLIFAGLFSAVASAFIIDIQNELRPDYQELSFAVLTMLLNTTSGVPNQLPPPKATGPEPSAVQVQSILFGSLASALLAAFLAMLGKQWLNLHVEGSFIDRSRHRELRMRGIITWRFKLIIEFLPLTMQISLLLLGYALTRYVWDLSKTVAAVIAAFTSFGFLFYILIVFAGTRWQTCPFQTPISLLLRSAWTTFQRRQGRWFSMDSELWSELVNRRKSGEPYMAGRSVDEETASYKSVSEFPVSRSIGDIPTSDAGNDEDEVTATSDFNCISTMFRLASTSEAIIAVTGFIPEINWTSRVPAIPLLQVYESLRGSFELPKDGRVFLRSGMRDQAYASAKALVHLRVQRSCAGILDDAPATTSKLLPILQYRYDEDGDLTSTLHLIHAIFSGGRRIMWEKLTLTTPHYCWLSHILRCRAWDILRKGEHLPADVSGFARFSLARDPLPPHQVVADCLLILDMTIGDLPGFDDTLFIKDKSPEIDATLQRIYTNLTLSLVPHSSLPDRERAIEVLTLTTLLKYDKVCDSSYALFRSTVATVHSEHSKHWLWEPAQLSFIGAFGWDASLPPVGDPKEMLDFLEHCLATQESGVDQDHPIERVFCALAFAADEESWRVILGTVDFSQPLFVKGLCHALRHGAPYLLRRSTVFILPYLDKQLFKADSRVLHSPDQVLALVTGWSSAVIVALKRKPTDSLKKSAATTLFSLVDSPSWRKYIPAERLTILELASVIGDELPDPFHRCLQNPTVLPYLVEENRGMSILWVLIQWMNFSSLSNDVRAELEAATAEAWARGRRGDPAAFVSTMDKEIAHVEGEIQTYDPWSFEARVVKLRGRLEDLQGARKKLVKLKKSLE